MNFWGGALMAHSEPPEESGQRRPGRKLGRPAVKNPLSYLFYIRLTEADGRRLDELADRLERGRGDLAREILLDGLKRLAAKK